MRDKQSEPQMGQMGKVTLFKLGVNKVILNQTKWWVYCNYPKNLRRNNTPGNFLIPLEFGQFLQIWISNKQLILIFESNHWQSILILYLIYDIYIYLIMGEQDALIIYIYIYIYI